MRRGQGSIEYLLILGVVIVLVLIIIGVIVGFQSSVTSVSKQQSDTYWAGADIGILPDHLVNSSAAYITVKNNRPFRVKIMEIKFIDDTGSKGNLPATFTLSPGASANVELQGVSCIAGTDYSYTVQIKYSEPSSGRIFTFTGETPLIGKCQ
ncbi:MAG: class III signal peptide-containing protein [Candidatus Micrarchaeia archaeon]